MIFFKSLRYKPEWPKKANEPAKHIKDHLFSGRDDLAYCGRSLVDCKPSKRKSEASLCAQCKWARRAEEETERFNRGDYTNVPLVGKTEWRRWTPRPTTKHNIESELLDADV